LGARECKQAAKVMKVACSIFLVKDIAMFLRANDNSYSTGPGGSIGISRDGL